MAFWFYRGVRRGIATTHYPKAVDPWARGLPSAPAFHSDRLSTAVVDALIRECPSRALAREDRELIVDLGRCTGCGRCSDLAPAAVPPSREFLLATSDRGELVKRVPIRRDAGYGDVA